MEDGLIHAYAQCVSEIISSLLLCHFQSMSELNNEIISVSKALTLAASKLLPLSHQHKVKSFIKDTELSSLRKQCRKCVGMLEVSRLSS